MKDIIISLVAFLVLFPIVILLAGNNLIWVIWVVPIAIFVYYRYVKHMEMDKENETDSEFNHIGEDHAKTFGFEKKSVFDLISEKLHSDLVVEQDSSNWKLKQELQLKMRWLEIAKSQNELWKDLLPEHYRNVTTNDDVSTLTIEEIILPKDLNDQEFLHYKFSEAIFKDYGKVLVNAGKYQKCFYKPASILPYPKDFIRKAIQFSMHCLQMEKPLFAPQQNKNEILDNLGAAKAFLDNFVDASENELPTDRRENMRKGALLS